MQTEQSPTPMNEEIVEEVGSTTNLDHHHHHHHAQQHSEGEQQTHHHHDVQQQQQQHQYEHGVVDMEALQTIAAQSAPLFANASNGGALDGGGMADSSGAEDAHNSPASNGAGHHHLQQHNGGGIDKRSTSPEGLSRTRSAPEDSGEEGGEGGEERDKKRQRRLLQNRQSAALSRQRKKEYLGGLERKNNELDAENKVLKQTVYTNDTRIRELESRLGFFIKQNEDLKNLLRTSDKVDEMNRLLAQAYSSLALQAAGIAVPGMLGLGFHVQPQETPQHLSAPSPANVVVGHIQQQPAAVSPPPPVDTHATVLQEQQQQQQQNLAPLSSLLTPESDAAELPTAPGSDPAAEAADARERCRRAHELATTPAATAETDVAQGGQ